MMLWLCMGVGRLDPRGARAGRARRRRGIRHARDDREPDRGDRDVLRVGLHVEVEPVQRRGLRDHWFVSCLAQSGPRRASPSRARTRRAPPRGSAAPGRPSAAAPSVPTLGTHLADQLPSGSNFVACSSGLKMWSSSVRTARSCSPPVGSRNRCRVGVDERVPEPGRAAEPVASRFFVRTRRRPCARGCASARWARAGACRCRRAVSRCGRPPTPAARSGEPATGTRELRASPRRDREWKSTC